MLVLTYSPSYEPTYEGLKPERRRKAREARKGYEPTYEGLKLVPVADIRSSSTVTSLPMRD